MSPSIRVRRLTAADLPFADSLRALTGWNQTRADWERCLAVAPEGCFLAEWNGAPAGTATTVVYGRGLAWIGMMLVHPAHRRQGIGHALMTRCLDHLHGLGVGCVKLDATPMGMALYEQLGFKSEWTLTRWQCESAEAALEPGPGVRPWRETDQASIDSLDAAAFGTARQALLRRLAAESLRAFVLEGEPGRIDGFGFLRAGAQARYLGPVVASSPQAACALIDALLKRTDEPASALSPVPAPATGAAIFWDVPDDNLAAVTRARCHGFIAQRPLTRMVRGANTPCGDPRLQFAIAGPEVG